MSSQPTFEELVAEAVAFGIDFSTPIDDSTPIEELRATLEFWSVELHQTTSPPTKPTSLELLEAASTYLTSAPEDNECAICVTELVIATTKPKANTENVYQTDTAIKLNACGHLFHGGCLLQWLKRANTCPYCRRRVCEEETKEEEEWDATTNWWAEERFGSLDTFWWV
ncbi:uncharacterized protein N0V89_002851 [Didymosphaeria variabile]|uniref:RING-type domain-containing protein n=1 Tax=Didymosphaeria variabile TaxID=1932322 RepID=A0A9W8XTA5_9PLEO|nr:uncharacterized protein N0V89_002851 [Didymosphaeria variabile]KAJ4358271.1 hypothetical protein N0V89_002851 [Didymosphaeria variabile]